MEDVLKRQVAEADYSHDLEVRDRADMLDGMKFADDAERKLCDGIIASLEKMAAEKLQAGLAASIPSICVVKKNPFYKRIHEAKLHLGAVRKDMTLEEYQDYVRERVREIKKEFREDEENRKIVRAIRVRNRKKYEKLCLTFGRAYAEMYILSICWMKEVPFDQEFEDQYARIGESPDYGDEPEETAQAEKASYKSFRLSDYLRATDDVKYRMKVD